MFARRHSRILRSQARISALRLASKNAQVPLRFQKRVLDEVGGAELGPKLRPDHLVGDHQEVLPASVEHAGRVVALIRSDGGSHSIHDQARCSP